MPPQSSGGPAFARQARRVSAPWFRCQAFLDHDSMFPAITEVIGVYGLDPLPSSTNIVRFVRWRYARPLLSDREFAEPLLPDMKLMHMAVFPTHRQLQDVMQLLQGQVGGHQQPTPDRWFGPEQGDLNLINLLELSAVLVVGMVRLSSMLRCGAPRCGRSRAGGRFRIC